MDDEESSLWVYQGRFYCSEACCRMASGNGKK